MHVVIRSEYRSVNAIKQCFSFMKVQLILPRKTKVGGEVCEREVTLKVWRSIRWLSSHYGS